MREIKFRAWEKKNKVMQFVGMLSWLVGGLKAYGQGSHIANDDYFVDNENVVLMQYTGLKDKNGKEIYEGDIVKVLQTDWASKDMNDTQTLEEYLDSKTEKYVVKFIAPNFHMLHKGVEDHLHYLNWGQHGYCEIIGNIYENPELLK